MLIRNYTKKYSAITYYKRMRNWLRDLKTSRISFFQIWTCIFDIVKNLHAEVGRICKLIVKLGVRTGLSKISLQPES